jgi:hypothetical protein
MKHFSDLCILDVCYCITWHQVLASHTEPSSALVRASPAMDLPFRPHNYLRAASAPSHTADARVPSHTGPLDHLEAALLCNEKVCSPALHAYSFFLILEAASSIALV